MLCKYTYIHGFKYLLVDWFVGTLYEEEKYENNYIYLLTYVSISENLKIRYVWHQIKTCFYLHVLICTYVRSQKTDTYINFRRNYYYLLKDLLAHLSLCSNSEYVLQQLLLKISQINCLNE